MHEWKWIKEIHKIVILIVSKTFKMDRIKDHEKIKWKKNLCLQFLFGTQKTLKNVWLFK